MFNFKQFSIEDNQSSMKIGMDSILLGSWVNLNQFGRILDIGTGCGILAIMLAQRDKNVIIDAIDIDDGSVEQAKKNFANSAWYNRLNVMKCDVDVFNPDKQYDLIISNPPYFDNLIKASGIIRNFARHTDTLPFDILAKSVKRLLTKKGRFALILPTISYEIFSSFASLESLYEIRKTRIFSKEGKKPERVMLEYSTQFPDNASFDDLFIRNQDGMFNISYIELTREFYLKF